MTDLFELEWAGGIVEHHYRAALARTDDLAWTTLDPSRYDASLVEASRKVWTDVVMSEYAAVVAFADVVSALAMAKAPLDLLGLASTFVADEVRHVELASRLVMQLGGAAARRFEPARFALRPSPGISPMQRANELVLRVSCIAEEFAGKTTIPTMRATTHPLIRDVYETIMRDEALHCRLGPLYFEWANERIDDAERERLGRVALAELGAYAELAKRTPGPVVDDRTREGWHIEQIHELGWLESAKYVPLVRSVVREQIIPSLRKIGLTLSDAEVDALMA